MDDNIDGFELDEEVGATVGIFVKYCEDGVVDGIVVG